MTGINSLDRFMGAVSQWAAARCLSAPTVLGVALAALTCSVAWYTAGSRAGAVAGGGLVCAAYALLAVSGQPTSSPGWRAVCVAGEGAIYAGVATGAASAERDSCWHLATGALVLLVVHAVADMTAPVISRPSASSPKLVRTGLAWLLSIPGPGRLLLVLLVTPVWGARITMLSLMACSGLALCAVLARSIGPQGSPQRDAPVGASVVVGHVMGTGPAGREGTGPAAWEGAEPAGREGAGPSARAGRASPPGMVRPAGTGRPAKTAWDAARPDPASARGDGLIARAVGRLARGQVAPLPAALAGLAATAALAFAGTSGLRGPLLLAPVAVMLLAAPGASHPHDGRLDWLVPPVLCTSEYLYVVAIGFGTGVAAPLTFALVGVVALRHLATVGHHRARLGWEGRMLLVGVAALAGQSALAYFGLAVCLGALLVWTGLSGWVGARQASLLTAAGEENQ